MASAKKLPSGSWRVNLYVGKDAAGKRRYKSFTAGTKKEAEFAAAAYNVENRHRTRPAELTVGEAIDQYIATKTAILSPSTLTSYQKLRRLSFPELMRLKLTEITQEAVQAAVNDYAKEHSPKTVRNAHALLTASLAEALPDFTLRTKLPPKVRPDIAIPEDKAINALIQGAKGTPMETAILLGAMLGLRRSEICALTWDDFDLKEKVLQINKAMVQTPENTWAIKAPKTYAGKRTLTLPVFLCDYLSTLPRCDTRIVPLSPDAVTDRFIHLRRKCGFRFRFHDLRHYNASVMLALGVPDRYAMERMGHATPNMLKAVYQHTMREKQEEVACKVNGYFSSMQHKMQHDK